MRIIIVEDDSKIAQVVSKGLTEAGYQIDHESDAESAIPQMVDTEYDAAVVDVMLPGMDGLSLSRYVRQQWPALY